MENYWEKIKDKKRIVIKVGSSTLTCKETGNLNYSKLEKLVRAISDLKNSGKQVILVSSGAVAVGRETLKIGRRPKTMSEKQACAAIGQGKLIMNYYKLFSEYGLIASQVLMTRYSLDHEKSYNNLKNTFQELLNYGAIPIVNENDAIATDEITDDPFQNKDAKLIDVVTSEIKDIQKVAKKSSDSDVGTGGMYTKVLAANIINPLGIDMIIGNGKNPNILNKIVNGEKHGTLFVGRKISKSNIREYLLSKIEK